MEISAYRHLLNGNSWANSDVVPQPLPTTAAYLFAVNFTSETYKLSPPQGRWPDQLLWCSQLGDNISPCSHAS